jgi:hypothetical protein
MSEMPDVMPGDDKPAPKPRPMTFEETVTRGLKSIRRELHIILFTCLVILALLLHLGLKSGNL